MDDDSDSNYQMKNQSRPQHSTPSAHSNNLNLHLLNQNIQELQQIQELSTQRTKSDQGSHNEKGAVRPYQRKKKKNSITVMPCLKSQKVSKSQLVNDNIDSSTFTSISQNEKEKLIIKNRSIPLKQAPVGIDQVGRKGKVQNSPINGRSNPISGPQF